MIPKGWSEKTFSSLLTVSRGFAFKSNQYKSEGRFVLRVSNIDNSGLIDNTENLKFISVDEAKEFAQYSLLENDVLLVMVGATTGKVGVVTQNILPALLNQNMWCLRAKPLNADQIFLKYLVQHAIKTFLSQQQGSAREFIRQSDFNSFKLFAPPLHEQKRIAEVLTSVDDAIQATEKVIEQTKKVKQGLLQELLTRGIGHKKFKKTEIGEIPESWEVVKIDDVLESSTYGINKSLCDNNDLIPVLRMGNIQENQLDLSNLKFCSQNDIDPDKHLLRPRDIVFNRTNSYDLVGKVALVNTDTPLSYASYLIRLRTNVKCDSKWLAELLGSNKMQAKFKSIATLGVSQCNINPTKMRNIKIPLPPSDEQTKMVNALESVNTTLANDLKNIAALKKIKSGLMQDLLTGRVRVGGAA